MEINQRSGDEIWEEHPKALNELILESLEKEDYSFLRGIQAFSEATRYAKLQGMETLMDTIFEEAVKARKEAKDMEYKLQENPDEHKDVSLAMSKRIKHLKNGEIPYSRIKSACSSMNHSSFLEYLEYLERNGYIEKNDSSDWVNATIRLPNRYWDGIIEDRMKKGQEDSVYSSALATMIAHTSYITKRGNRKTIKTLKVLSLILNKYDEGEISKKKLKEEYNNMGLSTRKLNAFLKRDQGKDDQISAIETDNEEKVVFNREMVRANNRWLDRTRKRVQERHR